VGKAVNGHSPVIKQQRERKARPKKNLQRFAAERVGGGSEKEQSLRETRNNGSNSEKILVLEERGFKAVIDGRGHKGTLKSLREKKY